jgi:hypothetical protein
MKASCATCSRLAAGALVLLFATAGHATAQEELRITLSAGTSEFDLSGTGNGFTASGRFDFPLRGFLRLEPGLGFLIASQQFGDTTTVLMPEAQVQVQLDRRLSPYLGLGAGLAADLRDEADGGMVVRPTVSGSAGIRLAVWRGVGVRAELRVRYHGTRFQGSTADLTGGLSYAF